MAIKYEKKTNSVHAFVSGMDKINSNEFALILTV